MYKQSLTTCDKISVELTTDKELINSILDTPEIYQMVNGTAYTKPFNTSYREELTNLGYNFLSVKVNDLTIGIITTRSTSKIAMECHIHILPEYHKKGYGKQAVDEGCKYLKEQGVQRVITTVPANCFHVLKFMKDNEFQACGSIPKAIIYNNQLVNLYIFERGV